MPCNKSKGDWSIRIPRHTRRVMQPQSAAGSGPAVSLTSTNTRKHPYLTRPARGRATPRWPLSRLTQAEQSRRRRHVGSTTMSSLVSRLVNRLAAFAVLVIDDLGYVQFLGNRGDQVRFATAHAAKSQDVFVPVPGVRTTRFRPKSLRLRLRPLGRRQRRSSKRDGGCLGLRVATATHTHRRCGGLAAHHCNGPREPGPSFLLRLLLSSLATVLDLVGVARQPVPALCPTHDTSEDLLGSPLVFRTACRLPILSAVSNFLPARNKGMNFLPKGDKK